jgi:hypothetical protein
MIEGSLSAPAGCSLACFTLDDLDVVTAGNDELQLAFLPQAGGRLISLRLNGDEVLWRKPGVRFGRPQARGGMWGVVAPGRHDGELG